MTEVLNQKIKHRTDLGCAMASLRVDRMQRERFDPMRVSQDWNERSAANIITDDVVAETNDSYTSESEL